ncbi:MAG: galactosyltransferase-related protein [Melioribacteraceae bacterium]|nr:galactosyltransferase-related protein [Melioribacteraceae bacterium]
MRYLFLNHSNNTIQIPDSSGKMIIFTKGQKIILDDYFKRYVPKYLSIIKIIENSEVKRIEIRKSKTIEEIKSNKVVNNKVLGYHKVNRIVHKNTNQALHRPTIKIVGKVGHSGARATEFSVAKIKEDVIPISNNIGVGILSYNRLESLVGLITSIRKHTDLARTTVFVSDESTDPKVWEWLKNQKDIIGIHNDRIGIAGNTNRLLRCLERFKYKIILNDDVEVLKEGWDLFYFNKMVETNIKHFCYRQIGIYNATPVEPNRFGIITVTNKPHGAVMAIHDDAFKKVGFMDEAFGIYGYEHVDYSDRISRAGLTPPGYHDVVGSDKYFKIYNDKTSDENKAEHFKLAREQYNLKKNDKSRVYIEASKKTIVPSITYIVPFRDIGRAECVETVIQNIRAQRFPVIQIVLSEQDDKEVMNKNKMPCADYIFSKNPKIGLPFNKSQAFNDGVLISKNENLILHDADMLVRGDYTSILNNILNNYESAHIGATVCYMTKTATDNIISIYKINESNIESDRIVNYYEGGSLCIKKCVYERIGGFCESFVGYGVEDCDFFWKIKSATKMFNERSINLFHLWHGRTNGWETYHANNKILGSNRISLGIEKVISSDADYFKRKLK